MRTIEELTTELAKVKAREAELSEELSATVAREEIFATLESLGFEQRPGLQNNIFELEKGDRTITVVVDSYEVTIWNQETIKYPDLPFRDVKQFLVENVLTDNGRALLEPNARRIIHLIESGEYVVTDWGFEYDEDVISIQAQERGKFQARRAGKRNAP